MELLMVILEATTNVVVISKVLAGLVAAFTAIGASLSISKIGITAIESIARQPEIAGDVRASMIISAALIEGLGFFAIVVCLLIVFL